MLILWGLYGNGTTVAQVSSAKSSNADGEWSYYSAGDTKEVVLSKYKGNAKQLTIPDKLDGKTVIAIDSYAFNRN